MNNYWPALIEFNWFNLLFGPLPIRHQTLFLFLLEDAFEFIWSIKICNTVLSLDSTTVAIWESQLFYTGPRCSSSSIPPDEMSWMSNLSFTGGAFGSTLFAISFFQKVHLCRCRCTWSHMSQKRGYKLRWMVNSKQKSECTFKIVLQEAIMYCIIITYTLGYLHRYTTNLSINNLL